jgi:hypothetical protein
VRASAALPRRAEFSVDGSLLLTLGYDGTIEVRVGARVRVGVRARVRVRVRVRVGVGVRVRVRLSRSSQ